MAKTNFTKIEEALTGEIHKMKVDELLKLADEASANGEKPKVGVEHSYGQLFSLIECEMKWMYKRDREIYNKLDIKKSELKLLGIKVKEKPLKLSEKEMKRIKELRSIVETYKKKHFPSNQEEEQIESERKKHINKRFNVNEKWLPLK